MKKFKWVKKPFALVFGKMGDFNVLSFGLCLKGAWRTLSFGLPTLATNDETGKISLWKITKEDEKIEYRQVFGMMILRSQKEKFRFVRNVVFFAGPLCFRVGWIFSSEYEELEDEKGS